MTPRRALGLLRPLTPIVARTTIGRMPARQRRGEALSWRRIALRAPCPSTGFSLRQSWPVTINLHWHSHAAFPSTADLRPRKGAAPFGRSRADVLGPAWSPPIQPASWIAAPVTAALPTGRTAMQPNVDASRPAQSDPRQRRSFRVAVGRERERGIDASRGRTPRLVTTADRTERRSSTLTKIASFEQHRRLTVHLPPRRATTSRRSEIGIPQSAPPRRGAHPLPRPPMTLRDRTPFEPAAQRDGRRLVPQTTTPRTPVRLAYRFHAPPERSPARAAGRMTSADLVWADRRSGEAPAFGSTFQPAFPPAPALAHPVALHSAPASPPPATPPDVDRLVDEVIRRIDRHNRSERLRRGI